MEIQFRNIDGYAYGAIQPTVALDFPTDKPAPTYLPSGLKALILELERTVAPIADETADYDDAFLPALLCRALDLLNRLSGDQRFTPIQTLTGGTKITCLLPTLSTQMTKQNLYSLISFLGKSKGEFSSAQARDVFNQVRRMAGQYLPRGTNPPNFIAAAGAHKIPMRIMNNGYMVFGYGSGSVIFNSSITDHEKAIGVGIARSKVDTNNFLRLSGFPVVEQRRIQTLDHAIAFADEFGYPVVLKPALEEQGRGIYANIQGAEDLAFCFEAVSQKYKDILIETHAPGDHYRVDFMGNDLIKAVRRRAPHAVGDGTSTIQALIDQMNLDPERLDPASSQKPIAFDDDLDRSLKNQGVTLKDVPEAGQSYYLKSISNLSRGGSQEHVEEDVHPENYDLCRAVARTMRVDVAGIDLLSPDLSQPWHSNGAVICEVNAKPQLGKGRTEIYWEMLKKYLGPQAHIALHISKTTTRDQQYLFDPENSEITLNVPVQRILKQGSPTQYYDTLTIDEDVTADERRALERILQNVRPTYQSS